MGLEQFGEKELARRNFWEADLFDENSKRLEWSPLIKSVTIPKISFSVDEIYGGTSKAYTGWKLPENISLTIWETSDHAVEKYLDSWMTGEKGVLGITNENGVAFRSHGRMNYLYRKLKIKTFIYENTEEKPITADVWNRPHLQKVVDVQEKQVIPLVDKAVAVLNGASSQAIAMLPFSDLTSKIPSVVVPPPLMTVFVPTGTPSPPIVSDWKKNSVELINSSVKWAKKEKVTSEITYTTAIESYDIGTYDYTTGDGVSYTVNLAVIDFFNTKID